MISPLVDTFIRHATEREGRSLPPHAIQWLTALVGQQHLPRPDESVGVTAYEQRAAALLFDRVWSPPGLDGGAPDGIRIFGGTDEELLFEVIATGTANGWWSEDSWTYALSYLDMSDEPIMERIISQSLRRDRGVHGLPLLPSNDALHEQYQRGDASVILAALADVPVVLNDELEWPQVIEFRKDIDAKRKYRSFVRWLDENMVGREATVIADEIAKRLEDYDWSLKKHGLRAAAGFLRCLIDPKFVVAASSATVGSAILGGPLWGGAAGALAILASAGLSVTSEAIDLAEAQRGSREIAFVRELSKTVSK